MLSLHKVIVAFVLLAFASLPAGGLLIASQGQGQYSSTEFPSKEKACTACRKQLCGKCYGVVCPGGCSITPPATGKDYQWFCAAIATASPWPGVRKGDEC